MLADRLDRGLTGVLVIVAVVMTGTAIHREFFTSSTSSGFQSGPPVAEHNWREALPVGVRAGDVNAPVTIVEFADLECPACRSFQGVLNEVMQKHQQDVSLVFVHYPLPGHRFALAAARAAECALSANRFTNLSMRSTISRTRWK